MNYSQAVEKYLNMRDLVDSLLEKAESNPTDENINTWLSATDELNNLRKVVADKMHE